MNAKLNLKLLTEARKTLVAIGGVLTQVIELGVLHGTALHYAQVASALVAIVLVNLVGNKKPAGS